VARMRTPPTVGAASTFTRASLVGASTIVGMKLVLNVALFKRYEKCVKLETPVPL
jgi:hypothetical protein